MTVLGGFNASSGEKMMLYLQTDFGLWEVYEYYYPTQESNIQVSGSKKIDNILISTELLSMVQQISYKQLNQSIQLDHGGCT